MKRQGLGIRDQGLGAGDQGTGTFGPAASSWQICLVRDCGRLAMPGSEMCVDCDAMDREYERIWMREHDPAYQYRRHLRTERIKNVLKNAFWISLFSALLSALGYYLFPFAYATWMLWTGHFPGGK